jgi:hypothetical protein
VKMFSERQVNVPNNMQVEWSLVSLFILDPRLVCRCGVDTVGDKEVDGQNSENQKSKSRIWPYQRSHTHT